MTVIDAPYDLTAFRVVGPNGGLAFFDSLGRLDIGSAPIAWSGGIPAQGASTKATLGRTSTGALGWVPQTGGTELLNLFPAGGGTNPFVVNGAGRITEYSGFAATNLGIPYLFGQGRAIAQTGAVAALVQVTAGANDGLFRVSANVLVTTSTTHNFTVTCAYTDEGNTARTVTFNFQILAGTIATAIINTGGAVPYEGIPINIRCKAGTTITIATTGTFTTVTYNVEGLIEQVAGL